MVAAMTQITETSIVTFHYTLLISNGQCYEETDPKKPCEIQMGTCELPPFLEPQLLGMRENESKLITIAPQDAYGLYNPQKIISFPKASFVEGETIKKGEFLEVELFSGDTHKATVRQVSKESVTLDLNHVLAGQTLVFDVHIIQIKSSEKVRAT